MPVLQTSIKADELQRYIVRVADGDGNTVGTGFFVAPGIVLTCAHVLKGMSSVTVVPADSNIAGPTQAMVVARSPTRSDNSPSEFWPFPDLAVIELEGQIAHPCVVLDPEEPDLFAQVLAWGYSRREENVLPNGSPTTFLYEGEEDDGFFKLKEGQVTPGLSGAPLLCSERRAVIGAVSMSRNIATALGGYASPASALLSDDSSLPEDLNTWGKRIWQENNLLVVSERETWAKVFPIRHAERSLSRPWAQFKKQPRSAPSDLLRADFGVTPYWFRSEALTEAVGWCKSLKAMSFLRIVGAGGSGKTRFAIELCRLMAEDGWLAGFWKEDSNLADIAMPRLVVFDYAEAYNGEQLSKTLDSLRQTASDAWPVAVVILNRPLGRSSADPFEALINKAQSPLRVVLQGVQERRTATAKLSDKERYALYEEALRRFYEAWHSDGAAPSACDPSPPDLSGARYDLPLDVLFEAFNAILGGFDSDTHRNAHANVAERHQSPIEVALFHELKYWESHKPADVDSDQLQWYIAAATLIGANDQDEADAVVSLFDRPDEPRGSKEKELLIGWLTKLYAGPKLFNPLRPDRLGETLVRVWLETFGDGGRGMLTRVLTLRSDEQVAQSVETLARIVPGNEAVAEATAWALADTLAPLTSRIASEHSSTSPGFGRYALIAGLLRLLSADIVARITRTVPALTLEARANLADAYATIGELAAGAGNRRDAKRLYEESLEVAQDLVKSDLENVVYQLALATSFDRLADLAREARKGSEARARYLDAFEIRQRAARSHPDNADCTRNLAISYNRLADLAKHSNNPTDARRLYAASLKLRKALVERWPENADFRRDLAIAYDRLGVLEKDDGQRANAHQLFSMSLEIGLVLVEREPGRAMYQRDLAIAYDRLAELALEASHPDEAREFYTASLAIAETLAGREPENLGYQRDLAISYESLADLAREQSDRGEAARLCAAALAIWQTLTQRDADYATYKRDLAAAYYRLGDIAREGGDPKGASRLYADALKIRQSLAKRDPGDARNQGDLAISYHRLADLARVRGAPESARRRYTEALSIRQKLVADYPDNAEFARGLAFSYHRLADLARIAGALDEAHRRYAESFEIRQRLVQRDYENDMYQRDLAFSLLRFGDLARAVEDHEEARRRYSEALEIRKKLLERYVRNAGYRRDFGVALHRLAGSARVLGEFDEAKRRYLEVLSIRRELVARDGANSRYQRDLAFTLARLADLASHFGRRDEARLLASETLSIRRELVKGDPENTIYKFDLKDAYDRCAELARASNAKEARRWYARAVTIGRMLVRRDTDNVKYRIDLAKSYDRLGDLERDEGHPEEARRCHAASHLIRALLNHPTSPP